MSIRRADLSDAREIAAVHVAAWRNAYRGLLPDDLLEGLSVEDLEKRWCERIARPWGHTLVAEEHGRILGFAACGNSQDDDIDQEKVGEIHVLYVHPEEWRHGYGTALLGEAAACLREGGFREAILWVLRGNEGAIRFYQGAGFEADGASKIKQRADGFEMPIVRYRRRL